LVNGHTKVLVRAGGVDVLPAASLPSVLPSHPIPA
jgi:hypothetical protein